MHLTPLYKIDPLYRYSQRRSFCIGSFLTCLALQSHFPPVYDLWHSQHPVLMYIYKHPFFAWVSPCFTLQLWKFGSKIWLGFPFRATASETPLPCWARLGCGWDRGFMPGLLVSAFYLLPYFFLDQVFFLLKGVFPDRPKVWYGSLLKKKYILLLLLLLLLLYIKI